MDNKIWAINNCENDEEVEYHSDNTLREMTMSGLDYVTDYYTMHRRLIFLKVSVQKTFIIDYFVSHFPTEIFIAMKIPIIEQTIICITIILQ